MSKEKSKKKKLLLGDSVAKQLVMYNKDNSQINSLACNQAVSMVGHYLLFKNYLAANNKIDTLVVLINPLVSFKNNLDQLFTFHYFLKPFYTEHNKSEFSEMVYNQIHKIPFYSASQFPFIKATNWSPDFKSTDPKLTTFLSPISREYLLKIKDLAEQNNITLLIYPPPLRQSLKPSIDSIRASDINVQGLEKEFNVYFNRVKYIDDQFYVDQPHFKKKFLKSHPNLLSEIL
ncbi:MAG: hypothetical protein ABIR81_08430 [Ginsengibacter sp.]